MGTDKGFVKFRGKPLIQHVIDQVKNHFSNIIIVGSNREYAQFGFELYPDLIPDVGPVGGAFTGLKHSGTEWNFLVACDMPFVNPHLIDLNSVHDKNVDAIVPCYKKQPEPFNAYYSIRCASIFEQRIQSGNYKFAKCFQYLNLSIIEVDNKVNEHTNPFLNINSMIDLNKITAS